MTCIEIVRIRKEDARENVKSSKKHLKRGFNDAICKVCYGVLSAGSDACAAATDSGSDYPQCVHRQVIVNEVWRAQWGKRSACTRRQTCADFRSTKNRHYVMAHVRKRVGDSCKIGITCCDVHSIGEITAGVN